jgi:hypothetical protein
MRGIPASPNWRCITDETDVYVHEYAYVHVDETQSDRYTMLRLVLIAFAVACGQRDSGGPRIEIVGDTSSEATVIRTYYGNIGEGDYVGAYQQWSEQGRASGQTLDEFRHGYAETADIRVVIGPPGRIEGAAGSRYVDVPVVIAAHTETGEDQCFRGVYTLRRAVVEGATPDQQRWTIYKADIQMEKPSACVVPESVDSLVQHFGRTLQRVSLLAPEETVRSTMRTEYGPLVTDSLLQSWLRDPANAPGRTVSSPWPERIEVQNVHRLADDRFTVDGELIYVTSSELAQGGAASRMAVVLAVVRAAEGNWRIAAYRAEPGG